MLRYEYENHLDTTVHSCNECIKHLRDCKYPTRNKEFGPCMYGVFKDKKPEVTVKNADWVLFQIRKQISNARAIAEGVIQEHRMNWQKPETLKDNLFNRPSVYESIVFKEVMLETFNFVKNKIKEIDSLSYSKMEYLRNFAKEFMYTYIEVEEDEIRLRSKNTDFIICLKKFAKEKGYKFDLLNKKENNNNGSGNHLRKRVEATIA